MQSKDKQRWAKLLQDAEKTGDVTFLVGKKRTPVRAHKCVLASSSEVMEKMLYGSMKEATSNEVVTSLLFVTQEVELGDDRLTTESFKAFIKYVYVGEANLTAPTVFGILSLAQLYDFGGLQEDVKKFFESLTPECSLDIISAASLWPEAAGTVCMFITENKQKLWKKPLSSSFKTQNLLFLEISLPFRTRYFFTYSNKIR